jgi:hypothetical protein
MSQSDRILLSSRLSTSTERSGTGVPDPPSAAALMCGVVGTSLVKVVIQPQVHGDRHSQDLVAEGLGGLNPTRRDIRDDPPYSHAFFSATDEDDSSQRANRLLRVQPVWKRVDLVE